MVPPERELVTVPLEVPTAHMVERPVHPALDEGEVGLGCIRRDSALLAVLLPTVVDRPMTTGKLPANASVPAMLVCHDRGAPIDVLSDRALESRPGHIADHARPCAPVALNQRNNGHLLCSAPALVDRVRGGALESRLAPDVGFVNLDDALHGRKGRTLLEGMADSVAHEPRRLVGDSEFPMQLVGRDTLL